ncbi:MAG: hypothetical protein HRT73_15075 [Flavobacteriales bacterium]|nr:hypothetical protein [Flavobacteriales bacterium]
MKSFFKYIAFIIITSFAFYSCSKTEEKEGCTDSTAINFSSLAVMDDGSCEYSDSSFTIWENGEAGFWGDPITGAFEVKSCHTGITTIFLNPDSTFILPDTIIDNAVTPPDTTITPADTLITGDTYLLVNSNSSGNYELIIQVSRTNGIVEVSNEPS